MSKYAEDGVNIEAGDDFGAYAGSVCAQSWNNTPYVRVVDLAQGHFRGPRLLQFQGLPEGWCLDGAPDGIGTKVVIISAALTHEQAAQDLLAMTAGDIERWGGLTLSFTSVLDVATLGSVNSKTRRCYEVALQGLARIARENGIVLYKGETAELGTCVGSDDPDAVTKFNWAGFALGVNHPNKVITGKTMAPGMKVVALREYGFRSNGMSSVRAAFKQQFGPLWWSSYASQVSLQRAAEPSTLYGKFLATVHGWYNAPSFVPEICIHGICHVTGGGIVGKFAHDMLFPARLSAELDDLWYPPAIMQQCAKWRGMTDEEAYRVWNGGQGMLVVLDQTNVERFLVLAKTHAIEAKVCGEIVKRPTPELVIHSKYKKEEVLRYGPKK